MLDRIQVRTAKLQRQPLASLRLLLHRLTLSPLKAAALLQSAPQDFRGPLEELMERAGVLGT